MTRYTTGKRFPRAGVWLDGVSLRYFERRPSRLPKTGWMLVAGAHAQADLLPARGA